MGENVVQSEVKYPAYRRVKEQRQAVNDALNALLAGSQLAANTLHLTAGSERPLSEIFPAVRHIDRFNLRTDLATAYLDGAERHLANIGLPYILSLHEAFVLESLDMLINDGRKLVDRQGNAVSKSGLGMANMHEVLFATSSFQQPLWEVELFHVLRLVRNALMHNNGLVTTTLRTRIHSLSQDATNYWAKATRSQKPSQIEGANGVLELDARHLSVAFGVTKHLFQQVNAALQTGVRRSTWARTAVNDFASGSAAPMNSEKWRSSLEGYARYNYGPINLTSAELEAAATSLGLWTLTHWGL